MQDRSRFRSTSIATLMAIALLVVTVPAHALSCLLFPLSCLKPSKKFGEEMEGRVLAITSRLTEAYTLHMDTGLTTANPIQNTKATFVTFVVGNTRYVAQDDDTVLTMAFIPKAKEFLDRPVKLRFMDQKWLGIPSSAVMLKRSNGKEWRLFLTAIIGPDGKDECGGKWRCPPQAKVDREAIERAQLEALSREGRQSATELAVAAVQNSIVTPVEAGTTAAAE